jgi:murein DD-endopeptidase MepM/ murein hydrolase activator NlpD
MNKQNRQSEKVYKRQLVIPTASILVCVAVILLLTGCDFILSAQSTPSPELPLPSATMPAATETKISLNLETHTPTAVPELSPTPSEIPATPDFSLAPEPDKSINPWRPPVYPVPWVPGPYDHFYFLNPIAAYEIPPAYSNYGYGDVFFENVVHTGIDIPGDIGIPILAAGEGRVIYAGQGIYRGGEDVFDDPYGKAIVIEHSFSYQGEPLFTLYAHLDEIIVAEGQSVQAGQKIGYMGNTGKTTGPHLHFEVRVGKNEYFSTRNPDLWISPPQGWGILVGQILTYEGRLHEQQVVYLHRTEKALSGGDPDDRLWIAKSYQNEAINSDPYYNENLIISNIPAGTYFLTIPVTNIGYSYQTVVEIKPGQVTFVKFNVWKGFSNETPTPPEINFSPSP